MDADDGQYRVNHPLVFSGIMLGQLLFMYVALKVGSYPFWRETKAMLSDLENEVTTGTEQLQTFRRSWRLWTLLFFVLFTLLLIWGIFRALN